MASGKALCLFGTRRAKIASVLVVACIVAGPVLADPTNPVYFATYGDAVTGDNAYLHSGQRHWTIDLGADSYQNELYERPTAQFYESVGGKFATSEYYEYVDIVQARIGFDSQYLYAAIDLFGRDKSTSDGLDTGIGMQANYGIRFSTDPNGRNGYFLSVNQTEVANISNTTYGPLKAFGWKDTDLDVGGRGGPLHGHSGATGLNVTKTDNPLEELFLNGFDEQIISDGAVSSGGPLVLFHRLDPNDNTIVEIAFDYVAAGLSRDYLLAIQYLDFQAIQGDHNNAQNSFWNDKYTGPEAGSPNPGLGGLISEFETKGLGNIYELDTVRGGSVPEPGTLVLLGLCGIGFLWRRRATV